MRKVFFVANPNRQGLTGGKYKVPENSRIKDCDEVVYPVIITMESFVEDKEKDDYLVVTVGPKGGNASDHIKALDQELKDRGFHHKLKSIELENYAGDAEMAKQAMKEMIALIEDGDDVYVNIEFGPKPILLAMIYSVLVVDNALDDVSIEGVFYGEKKFNQDGTPKDYVFSDVSYLYYIGRIAGNMVSMGKDALLENIGILMTIGEHSVG